MRAYKKKKVRLMKKNFLFLKLILFIFSSSVAYGASLEQKVGQMVMVAFNGTSPNNSHVQLVKTELKNGLLGGVIIGGANVENPQQLKSLMQSLQQSADAGQKISGQKALFSIDQEGGIVARLSAKKGFGKYPRPLEIAQKNDIAYAQKIWKEARKTSF